MRRAGRAAARRAAAGAVGAGARRGAGRGLVRRDTLTSGASDTHSYKGDARSPAPGAGLVRQVPGHALPGYRHLAPPHPWVGCLLKRTKGVLPPRECPPAPADCGPVAAGWQPRHRHDSGDLLGFQVASEALPKPARLPFEPGLFAAWKGGVAFSLG